MKLQNPFRRERHISEVSRAELLNLKAGVVAELSETFSQADIALAMEDIGWERMGGDAASGLSQRTRAQIVKSARYEAVRGPLTVQTLRMWRVYVLGRGVTLRASTPKAQEILDDFWDAPQNRSVFGNAGLSERLEQLYIDGELPYVLFRKPGGLTRVRWMDPLQIEEIVTNPEDKSDVWGYKRRFTKMNHKESKLFYRDLFADPAIATDEEIGERAEGYELQEGVIHFSKINTAGGPRGNSLFTATLDWSNAHRDFMGCRTAIQKALARFAWKKKIKGGQPEVNAAIARLQSGFAAGAGRENNPPPAAGSTLVDGTGSDTTPIKHETGAQAAQVDGAMLLQMAGAGAGIFPIYFGAGESFRLATASAMELPMLKMFEAEQQRWASIFNDLIQAHFESVGLAEADRFVDIDFPPIVEKDAAIGMDAIAKAIIATPSIAAAPAVQMLILTTLGINNASEVLDDLGALPAPGEKPQEATAKLVEALREFKESVKGDVK